MAPSKKTASTSKATPSFTILQEEPAQSASVAETSVAETSETVACASEAVAATTNVTAPAVSIRVASGTVADVKVATPSTGTGPRNQPKRKGRK